MKVEYASLLRARERRLILSDPAYVLAGSGKQPDPWQAQVLRSDSLRILLLCSRQSGKSTVAAALAVHQAISRDRSLILLLSPTLRQSGELFRDKVLRLYKSNDGLPAIVQESALQITIANGSRILSLPGEEETIRGYSGVSLLIIDEASRVKDELYKSVRPMLAVSGGRLVVLSTPFGKQGWFYQTWNSAPGWTRVKVTADQCPRISREFLEDELRTLGEQWYSQEYLCEFTDSAATPLFPALWLDSSARRAASLRGVQRRPLAMGCDPAQGGDMTCWCVIDRLGVIEMVSKKTSDTSVITGETIALGRKHGLAPRRWMFDAGGGGKQHADRLRAQGYAVRTVGFGERMVTEPKWGYASPEDRKLVKESKVVFFNRRAQMYGELSQALNPDLGEVFAIPAELQELHRQLAAFPKLFNEEGVLWLPPKDKKNHESKVKTLTELIGHSPDEADALAIAYHCMTHREQVAFAGAG